MKKFFTTISFISIVFSIFAQSEIQVSLKDTIVGKNLKTNHDIKATSYLFPDRVHHLNLDTATNLLTVQLRGINDNDNYYVKNGNILLYDLSSNMVKWSRKLNYNTSKILQLSDLLVRVENAKSYRMSTETGEDLWEAKNRISLINAKHKIGIGYIGNTTFKACHTLEGIDLLTGKAVWQRELSYNYEWNTNFSRIKMWDDAFQLNDSVAVIAIRGLHGMNYKTGEGWDYDTKVLTFGLSFIHDLFSNIIRDSSSIYMASKTQLVRLDDHGKTLWNQPLVEDLTSSSSIFIKNNQLYMVNFGSAMRDNNKQVFEGKPYLASFSLTTGTQQLSLILDEKKQKINGFKTRKDTIFLILKNKISKYSLKDGSLIFEKPFQIDSLKEPQNFLGNLVYVKEDSTYKRLNAIDSTTFYITTGSEKIVKLNNNFELQEIVDTHQFYYLYLRTKDYRFIAKENETIVLDKDDKIVATFQASSDARLIGSKLYDSQKQNLFIIDLAELINR